MGAPLARFSIQKPTGIQLDKYGQILGGVPAGGCPPGFTLHAKGCYESTALQRRFADYEYNKRHGFIPTLIEVGPAFVAGFGTLVTAGLAAPLALTSLGSAAKLAGTVAGKIGSAIVASPQLPKPPGGNMGLNLGQILSTVGNVFGGNQNQIFQGISSVATLANAFVPQATQAAFRLPSPQAMAPAVAAGRAMVGRGFFSKYPNLATSIQQLRARGFSVKRSHLWNLLKRFGPELVVSGGLLTAAAVSELMVAGPGRRTMNPANAKALRRAARRIKGFHKLCGTVDLLKSRSRSRSSRCGTCRKSPCRC